MKGILWGPVLVVVWSVIFGPPLYWALPLHGQVVDGDSGQQLGGVIVVAHWELRSYWESFPVGQLAIMETVTDAEGRFTFRWWRPRLHWPLNGTLKSKDPQLLLFKSGYKTASCQDSIYYTNPWPIRWSDCNGRKFELKKFSGTLEQYADHLSFMDTALAFATEWAKGCEWKKIPRMLTALHQETVRLAKQNVKSPAPLVYIDTLPHESWCGSAKEFFRSYLP